MDYIYLELNVTLVPFICSMWTIFTISLQPAGHPLTYGGHYCVKSTPDAITVGHMKTSHCVWNHRRVKFIMFHSRSILLVCFTILGLSFSCIPTLPQPPPCVELGEGCGLFVGRCCGGKFQITSLLNYLNYFQSM